MLLHCVQLLPHTPYRDAECKKYLNMHPGQTEVGTLEGLLVPALFCVTPLVFSVPFLSWRSSVRAAR